MVVVGLVVEEEKKKKRDKTTSSNHYQLPLKVKAEEEKQDNVDDIKGWRGRLKRRGGCDVVKLRRKELIR